jgi:GH15 family glucan-1,4-alpha-glucosidase
VGERLVAEPTMTTPLGAQRHTALARRSIEIIRANQHPGGAYLASPNFPVYRYSWLRDGAFIADAMSRAGAVESAESFFGWCARQLTDRADQVASLLASRAAGEAVTAGAFLPTRFTVEGGPSGEEWPDFQLDGYGAWLWALDAHARRHKRSPEPWLEGAVLSARYIRAFWQEPSYDWWEEHPDHRHGSTLGALYAGLRAVGGWSAVDPRDRGACAASADAIATAVLDDGRRLGRLAKWLGGPGIDGSLVASGVAFGLLDPGHPLMTATVRAIRDQLVVAHGVHRYPEDTYYGGGQWLLLAAMLGWHDAAVGDADAAWGQLDWVADHATAEGHLPEQVPDRLLAPDMEAHWLQAWGPVASPLLWSHAMYLTLALELGVTPDP